jgi:hypothetical protein
MGQQYLEEHRLKPDSPTRRVMAKCCNSAMFLDFTKGHWLSMFRNRFPAGAPPLEMRLITKERRAIGRSKHLPYCAGLASTIPTPLLALNRRDGRTSARQILGVSPTRLQ